MVLLISLHCSSVCTRSNNFSQCFFFYLLFRVKRYLLSSELSSELFFSAILNVLLSSFVIISIAFILFGLSSFYIFSFSFSFSFSFLFSLSFSSFVSSSFWSSFSLSFSYHFLSLSFSSFLSSFFPSCSASSIPGPNRIFPHLFSSSLSFKLRRCLANWLNR